VTWTGTKSFVGGDQDPTGLIHEGAREYDALLGRFTSLDPIFDASDPQSWNGYAYADNNPVINLDPTGTISQCISIDGSGVCGSQLKNKAARDNLNDYEARQHRTSANESIRSTAHCATLGCYNACKYGGCGNDTSKARHGQFAPPPPPKPRGRSWLGTAVGGLKGAAQNISHAAAAEFHNDVHSLTSAYTSTAKWIMDPKHLATIGGFVAGAACLGAFVICAGGALIGLAMATAGNYYKASGDSWIGDFHLNEFAESEVVDVAATVMTLGVAPEASTLLSGAAKDAAREAAESAAVGERVPGMLKSAGSAAEEAYGKSGMWTMRAISTLSGASIAGGEYVADVQSSGE
jgi:RHS repeat-associated protein